MARQIRLSKADALAAGLIDPAVADLVAANTRRSKPLSKKTASASASAPAQPKRKRSPSRPAIHPKISEGPAGAGQLTLLADGKVGAADFVFDLVPVPKERPRVVTNPKTDKAFGYTPARTKYFTIEVRRVIEHVFEGRAPIEGPVRLQMTFVMQVPKSWPKWKRQAALDGIIVPTGRPDMDNLEKALLDAFNDCLIVDDAFVVDRRAGKIYGESPQILAQVEQTGQLDINARRETVERLRRLRAEGGEAFA